VIDELAAVVALEALIVPGAELPALRKAPAPAGEEPIAASLLKHGDDQTAAALAAVLRARQAAGLGAAETAGWGVIAAPRFLGRERFAVHMAKYRKIGASGVSPLIIPNLSLHSIAGTISLALGTHGTNSGAGGGHANLAEALFSGATTLEEWGLPGVWIVASQSDPEPRPDRDGKVEAPSAAAAVALGLMRPELVPADRPILARVRLDASAVAIAEHGDPAEADALPMVRAWLARDRAAGGFRWRLPVAGLGNIEVVDEAAWSVRPLTALNFEPMAQAG
jgi:hypothetical protein